MRIVLADIKGGDGFISKDTVVGGYGSRLKPFSKVTRVVAHMLPAPVSSTTTQALQTFASAPGVLGNPNVFKDPAKLRQRLGMLIAAAAAAPEFQFRG